MFYLSSLLRSGKPPLNQLCLRIGSFCQTTEALLRDDASSKRSRSPESSPRDSLRQLSERFAPGYLLVLRALDHATAQEATDNELTIANGSIVQLFQLGLGQLHKFALDEVTRRETESQAKGKKAKSNTAATKTDLNGARDEFDTRSTALVLILTTIMDSIDPKLDSHCELLEGLLCALLDHLGSSLGLVVFADSTASKKEAGLEPPSGLMHVAHVGNKAAITAAGIEAPYLISVLKAALKFLRDHQQQMTPNMKEIISWADPNEIVDPEALRQKIEARLQGTLLRGVFGDDDTAFENALRREHPLEETDLQAIAENEEAEVKQDKSTWMIGQVWEQLGWDVLGMGPITGPVPANI